MCNISKGVEERGIAKGLKQGMEKGIFNSILNLMSNMKLTAEQAMNALGVPKDEYEKYEEMLKHTKM